MKIGDNQKNNNSDFALNWFHIFLLSLCLKGDNVKLLRLVGRNTSNPDNSPADTTATIIETENNETFESSLLSLGLDLDLTHEQVPKYLHFSYFQIYFLIHLLIFLIKIILLNGYQSVFNDPLFIKQTKEQTLSEDNNISTSLSSLLELVDFLLEIIFSHYNSIFILSSTPSTSLPSINTELSFQQIDTEILKLSSIKPSITHSLSIPVIPTLIECISSIIVAFDEIYSENSSLEIQSRESIRQVILQKQIDDICLRILIANKRRTSEIQPEDKLYWNDVIKSCLHFLMNFFISLFFCPSKLFYY